MSVFAGLYGYEVVMLVMGVALFLVVLIALLRNVFKDKPFAQLLPAFLISVVMVGYPSIKSFQYGDAIVQIQNANAQLEKDPGNQQAQATVRDLEAKIEPRAKGDPNGLAATERAENLLGNRPEPGRGQSGVPSRIPSRTPDRPATGRRGH
jgi:hypothetical protein